MRKKVEFLAMLMLEIFLIVNFSGLSCNRKTEVPPDTKPYWDTDGDKISNAVETNNANSYLGLDPNVANPNPSIAHGSPCDGWIEKALNLVDAGTGYWHNRGSDPVDTDDWGVLDFINMIEGAGRQWFGSGYTSPRITVNDLSKGDASTQQFGGPFPPHSCHQNGLEADFRYVRNDGNEWPLDLGDTVQIKYYDGVATAALMTYLFNNGNAIYIIVSPLCEIEFENITAVYDASGNHNDHFHLRIEDPDGTGN